MESDFNVKTVVRLADMLPLLDAQVCPSYLCHYVAYMLRAEIAKHPAYQQFHRELFVNDDSPYHTQRNHAIPYYFLVRAREPIRHHDLQCQVIPQINAMIATIRPDLMELIGCDRISEMVMSKFVRVMSKFVRGDDVSKPYVSMDSAIVRLETIKKILSYDPDAEMSISL